MTLRAPGTPDTGPHPIPASPSGAYRLAHSGHPPTDEQAAILDAYRAGGNLVVEALAGTGKTTTLKMLAALNPARPGTYLVFNKASQTEAAGQFPSRVNVTTAHSLAYRAVGHAYAHRLPSAAARSGSKRVPARVTAQRLRIAPAQIGLHMSKPEQLVRLAEATVAQFCQSDSQTIRRDHLPEHARHLGPMQDVAAAVLPIAQKVWSDLLSPGGECYFTHDHYLKIWQLGNPRLPVDYIMFDEAQDANPVIAAVVAAQIDTQRIYVGDRNQQLYAWRGAVDALDTLDGVRLPLTRSFRFGPVIAEQANYWLGRLGSDLQVVGAGPYEGRIGIDAAMPDVYLCRGNGTAIELVLSLQGRGLRVALAPGDRSAGADIRTFAFAALDLQAGRGTDHFELSAFRTWSELLEYVEEETGTSDLKRMVNIVNRVGASRVIDAIKQLRLRADSDVMVSTAHKAKGLEWDRVQVADDFAVPVTPEGEPAVPDPAELMLAYVTVTRAKRELDPGSLAQHLWNADGQD
jgi:hypothetical protein